ncbi:hypothetical protein JCM10295v2_005220 [Rhodotorula toruloides]
METGRETATREPFVSLGRLFLACSVTPLEGLLLSELDNLAYDVSLGGLAPVLDIWVPLKIAREVADSLGRLDELAALLDWQTRRAWSVEDKEEGALVHNWKISSDLIDPQDYSTASMLDTSFARVELLPLGSQVRTLLPPHENLPTFGHAGEVDVETWDMLWSKIVEWSVREYGRWKDRREMGQEWAGLESLDRWSGPGDSHNLLRSVEYDARFAVGAVTNPSVPEVLDAHRFPLFFASTLSSLLALLHLIAPALYSSSGSPTLSPSRARNALFSHLPHIPPLLRSSFSAQSSSLAHSLPINPSHEFYLLDALSRLFIHVYRMHLDSLARERFQARRKKRERREREEEDWCERLEGRLRGLEGEVLGVRRSEARPKGDREERGLSAQLGALEDQVERLAGLLQHSLRHSRAERAWQFDGRFVVGAAFVSGLAVGVTMAMSMAI